MSAARIAELQRMVAARQGKPGFTRNVQAIHAEIARLQSHHVPRSKQPLVDLAERFGNVQA